jgi:predicted ATPase
MYYRGYILVMQGQIEEGLMLVHQALHAYQSIGTELPRSVRLTEVAGIYGHVGQVEEGLRVIDEAISMARTMGEHVYEPERYRLQGLLLLAQSTHNHAEAAACFWQALDIARQQQTKTWEIRAATSLAHLWQQQGKRQEARELLTPVYRWFTEGFDTTDLQEARALLEELG